MLSSSRDTCLSCHVCVTMAQITSTLYLPKWRHSSKSSLIKTTQDKVNFYLFKKMRFSCYKYNPVLRFYPDRKCSVTIIWRHKESNFRRSLFLVPFKSQRVDRSFPVIFLKTSVAFFFRLCERDGLKWLCKLANYTLVPRCEICELVTLTVTANVFILIASS